MGVPLYVCHFSLIAFINVFVFNFCPFNYCVSCSSLGLFCLVLCVLSKLVSLFPFPCQGSFQLFSLQILSTSLPLFPLLFVVVLIHRSISFFSYKATKSHHGDTTLMTQSHPQYLPHALQMPSSWGLWLQHIIFGGTQIFSPLLKCLKEREKHKKYVSNEWVTCKHLGSCG